MYNLLLTDDASKWPWHAYVNLPLIPIALILSRTPFGNHYPIVPLLLAWPISTPIAARVRASWQNTFLPSAEPADPWPMRWPPSPLFVGLVVFPFVRAYYKLLWWKLVRRVMKKAPQEGPPNAWRLTGVPLLRFRIGGPDQPPPAQQAPGGANNANQPQDAAAVAEQTIHVTGASLGRFIGGALVLPEISSIMGSALYRLSSHSAILKQFLAIRPRALNVARLSHPIMTANWDDLGIVAKFETLAKLFVGSWWGAGSSMAWADSDPVW
jgi:hypothetical protein